MTEQNELFAALLKFHKDCPEIKLDSEVSFGKVKFKYASLGGIIKTIKTKLIENDLYFMHLSGNDGVRCRVFHSSGKFIESEPLKIAASNDAKQQGAAITYAKRYTLCAILGLSAEDDKDAPATTKPMLSNDGFEQAKERIKKGELKVFIQCLMNFDLSEEQMSELFELSLWVDKS